MKTSNKLAKNIASVKKRSKNRLFPTTV